MRYLFSAARRRIVLFLALLMLALSGVLAPVTTARAASITVNSNADTQADDGVCTLREAIVAANTDTASGATAGECAAGSGADAITFDPPVWAMFERKQFWEAHRVMLEREYYHLENMSNLDQLPPYGFTLCVLPIKWVNTTAAPVRAIAIIED